jgi:hypothetical protein
LTALPHGIYGGTVQGVPDASFVLVARSSSWNVGTDSGWVFVGPDLAGQARLVRRAWLSTFGGCDSNDPRTYNTYMLGERAYAHVVLDPAVPSLVGTIRLLDRANTTYILTGGPIAGSTFDAKARPQIGDFAGTWQLTEPDGASADLAITPDGNFSGLYRGCRFSGTATPDAELNLVSLPSRFDAVQPTGCSVYLPATFAGEGFALLLPGASGEKQLVVWLFWSDGWDGVELSGIGRR